MPGPFTVFDQIASGEFLAVHERDVRPHPPIGLSTDHPGASRPMIEDGVRVDANSRVNGSRQW